MKWQRFIDRHPYLAASTAAVLGVTGAETINYAVNRTYDIPEGSCLSPFAVSRTYVEPGTNHSPSP